MTDELNLTRVAILTADDVERSRLEQPRAALEEADTQADLLAIRGFDVQAFRHAGLALALCGR